MNNSKDTPPTTCFSSILRRLLCTGGLPTHPSSDPDNPKEGSSRLQLSKTASPIKVQPSSPTRSTTPAGIVARLMGLDSFPNSIHTTLMRKSRSVGSVDFLPSFDITKQPRHLRARTSVSFRELPTFLQYSHNHDIKKADPVRKSEMGLSPIEEKSQDLNKKKKIQSQKQSLKVKSEEGESSVQGKCRGKRGVLNVAKKKVVDDGFPEEPKKNKCKSRKKTYNHPLPKMGKHDRKAKKKAMLKRRESEDNEEYCIKVLTEVCRLSKEEIDGSVWVVNNLQDISYEIGQEILQVLVYETIDELCRFP